MFKELISLIENESPLAWIIGAILANYLAVKILRDVYSWIKSVIDGKKKDLTDSLARCQLHDTRIGALELEFKMIRSDLKEIKTMLKLRPGFNDGN